MLSLFRSLQGRVEMFAFWQRSSVLRAVLCSIACIAGFGERAVAADAYFIPELSLRGEHHTNLELTTEPSDSISGYTAQASGIFGLRTPRNVTEVRPRVEFVDFPARDETRRTNGYLDFNSQYNDLRSSWAVVGSYWRETAYEAERTEAQFDEFDPNDPSVETPSRTTLISETRTRIQLRPSFNYKWTERVGFEVKGLYQTVNLDSEVVDENVEYEYLFATGGLTWALNPKTQLSTGVYGAEYDSDDDAQVSAKGVALSLGHDWSQTFSGYAALNFERTDIDNVAPLEDEESDNFGIDVGLVRTGQVSRLRFSGGRTYTPSSAGSRTVLDQVRVQYSRSLRVRWGMLVAARAFRSRDQGVANADDDRDYATLNTELSWNMTQRWSLNGGYTYTWKKFRADSEHSEDHMVFVGIRFQGLRPQR